MKSKILLMKETCGDFFYVKKKYTDWIQKNLEIFSESEDFHRFHLKVKTGPLTRTLTEYTLTLETAKHIALMSRTEKGKEIRNYFIEVEKRAKKLYQRIENTPTTTKAMIAIKDSMAIADLLDLPKHIGQVESIKMAKQITGLDYSHMLLSAPEQDNIQGEEIMLEPTELGGLFKLSAIKMNRKLSYLGLQNYSGKKWIPTIYGTTMSMNHHWEKAGKSGYNLKWNVEKIRKLIKQARSK